MSFDCEFRLRVSIASFGATEHAPKLLRRSRVSVRRVSAMPCPGGLPPRRAHAQLAQVTSPGGRHSTHTAQRIAHTTPHDTHHELTPRAPPHSTQHTRPPPPARSSRTRAAASHNASPGGPITARREAPWRVHQRFSSGPRRRRQPPRRARRRAQRRAKRRRRWRRRRRRRP